ncbi:MAG: hypothetical protein Q4B85_07295 [Lachnospiraceae bacterium]|nr:hypothetical protein [Lachnospiraceae bacterium]
MKQLYGNMQMTWFRVILFAILAGFYTGAVMCMPFLWDTSFQDIGICFEWWVIFAVIIVVNCDKGWEAMQKIFLFFLISQPMVYLVEVVYGKLTFDLGWHYYRRIWLPMTFLTIPGGLIAWFCKKQNVAGAIILGLGNTILALEAISHGAMAANRFPHHILSVVICVASIITMSINIQKEKKNRMVALLLPVVLTIVLMIFLKMSDRVILAV